MSKTEQKKKLIEVAMPLDAINAAVAHERGVRLGHPGSMHLWWSRKPLAVCRAVLFASLVDDPSSHPEQFSTEEAQERERQRLMRIIADLVVWENSDNVDVLAAARREIARSTGENPPPVLDPFCGGGSIPLEAQRLGLEAHASDLNPVAVLITKALIEIPTAFYGQPPVNPAMCQELGTNVWEGAQGLAEDVRYYGTWLREEAEKRIGHLYPKVRLPVESGGGEATPVAWLWARAVRCPNPACGAEMPLTSKWLLAEKPGRRIWAEPVPDATDRRVHYVIREGNGLPPDCTVNRRGATCVVCGGPAPLKYVQSEGRSGRLGAHLVAIALECGRERVYVAGDCSEEEIARSAVPSWAPDAGLVPNSRHMTPVVYGMTRFGDLFTARQLTALSTFSDLIPEAMDEIRRDAENVGRADGEAYAAAVATSLALALDRSVNAWSTLATWNQGSESIRSTFSRQALPMSWDFAEANPFGTRSGNWLHSALTPAVEAIARLHTSAAGTCRQADATASVNGVLSPVISTDPPYYDNIPFSDLSDYFYVWLRHSMARLYPGLFATMVTPKAEELVADPFRHGGASSAAYFFQTGLGRVFDNIRQKAHPDYPVTLFYAFKQREARTGGDRAGTTSTGWETMLQSLVDAGFRITGTWPIRTEHGTRLRTLDSNALASSIVLVCRPREVGMAPGTRRSFEAELRRALPEALRQMIHENIAPVDLAQAVIGPGMAAFSRFPSVLQADGRPMTVREALHAINQELDKVLTEQEGAYDAETRFCLDWYGLHGFSEGRYGDAEQLCLAKNLSLRGLQESGVLVGERGRVRLLTRDELPGGWDPRTDARVTLWECTQHLVKALMGEGEEATARLALRMAGSGDEAKNLAYRLFTVCVRKGWAQEATAYNNLVIAWPAIQEANAQLAGQAPQNVLL